MLATGTASPGGALRTAAGVHVLTAAAAARLIYAAVLAWLAGIALQLQQAHLADASLVSTLPACAGVAVLAALLMMRASGVLEPPALRTGVRALAGAALLTGVGLLGWVHAERIASERLAQRLAPGLEQHDLLVTGVVARLPQVDERALRFIFKVEQASLQGRAVVLPPRLSIGWYAGWGERAGLAPHQRALRAGQRWVFTLRLRRPHGNLNPHGYDHELHLFERGIGATGYVRDGPVAPRLLDDAAAHPVERLRQTVRAAIEARVSDPRAAGVLAALAIGDQSAIDRGDWQIFRDSGIAHLVAISGLHVTMFAWLAAGLLGWIWRRSSRAPLCLPAPLVARFGGVVAAAGYALLAGWGVPAQRTVLMLAITVLLGSLGRRWPWPMVLGLAATAVTAFDPWALLQPGFWLSFVAVGVLFAVAADPNPARASGGRSDANAAPSWPHRATQRIAAQLLLLVRSQALITLALAPLTVIFFQQISLVGMAANLIAIPLVTLVITPLALLGIVLPWLWQPAALAVQALIELLAVCTDWPWAVWTVAAAPAWAQLAGLVGAALAALPLPWRVRLLALPMALPMLAPPRELPPHGRFELIALDVGQGTAVLVRTRGRLLLYDTGPRYGPDSDAAGRALIPLLRGRGERRIDRLILSHRDSDHVGGARTLLHAMPVADWFGSLEDEHPLRRLPIPNRRCATGQRWQWDGVDFEILHPPPNADLRQPRANGLSCVLRISASAPGGGSALLTGDIERRDELTLVAHAGATLRSTLLLVPHHGSRSSSSAELLAAVAPEVALVQAGYRNRFGHPAPAVVERYRSQGIALIETVRCGAWHWRGDALGRETLCERERVRRYWHTELGPSATAR